MSQHYSDPTRESETYALPDLEVFYRTRRENRADDWSDSDGEPLGSGWFYWFCFPGCMPDSDPIGPFNTEAEALEHARDND